MVFEHQHPSQGAAITSIAEKFAVPSEMSRKLGEAD